MPAVAQTSSTAPSAMRVWPWLLLAALVVAGRGAIFVWRGPLAFDGDQALVGIMAKHISEGRAFPVFQYALPYILIVSAWVSVPFFWVMGPTIAALKVPVLLLNVALGVWLVRAIAHVGVRPAFAFAIALPLLAVAPITASGLMDALGMTIEPLVFVALLWGTRRSPVLFGVVAGVGFLVREFVAYGVAAVWLVDMVDGRGRTPAGVRHWALVLLASLGTKASVDALNRFGSAAGPGTWFPEDGGGNLTALSSAFCFEPQQAATNVLALGQWYVGLLLGAVPARVSDGAVQTAVRQGAVWLWPLLGVALLVMIVTTGWRWRALWAMRRNPGVHLAIFLAAVGAQSLIVYAISRCSLVSVLTVRYALLGIFVPSGVVLAWWLVEPRRWLRVAGIGTLVLSACVNLVAHAALWREQVTAPPPANRADLARELERRGVFLARSDYWTAYYVSFISQERVIVSSTGFARVDEYERRIALASEPVPTILMEPCGDEPPIVPGFWLCPP